MKAFRLGDLVDVILSSIATRPNMAREKIEVNITGLVPGEKLHEELMNEDESTRMYELDDMYVVLPTNECHARYAGISKVSLSRYASSDVDLLSLEEIEKIVMTYLKSRWLDSY